MHKNILLLLLVWMTAVGSVAQPYCDVHTFTIRDGLAANTISDISQTPDGLMWFSTWNGLCFYDGYRFTAFRNRPGTDDVLSTNRVLGCKPSKYGNVWCLTSDNQAYLYNTHTCRFMAVSDVVRRTMGHVVAVQNVYPLANGQTWLVGRDGTENYRIDEARLTAHGDGIEVIGTRGKRLRGVVDNVVLGADGREWIFTRWGLENPTSGQGWKSPAHDRIYGTVLNHDTWFATSSGYLLVARDGRKPVAVLQIPVGAVTCMARWGTDRLLIGTDQGIYEIRGGRVVRRWSVQMPGQPSPSVRSLFVDSHRRVWAFTGADGVVMLHLSTGQRSWLQSKADNPMLTTECDQPLIHEDGHGTLWMVPAGGTFSYYCERESRLKPYTLGATVLSASCIPYIKKFFVDKDRNLWFTGYRDVTLVNFRYRNFKYLPVLPNQEVRSLFTDSKGRMWIGMQNGEVAVYDRSRRLQGYLDKRGLLQSRPVAFDRKIFVIREDSARRMWIGTKGNGLYILDAAGRMEHYTHDGADPYSLSSDDVYDIDTDTRGHTWIATFGGGLNLIDRKDGRLRFVHPGNQLRHYPMAHDAKIRRVTHTAHGVVLLSTTGGLVTFSDRFASPSQIRFFCNQHTRYGQGGLGASDVLQTLVTRRNGVLVVTLGGGLQQIMSGNLLSDHLRFTPWGQLNTDEGIVQSIAEANNGDIWMMREGSIMRRLYGSGNVLQYVPDTQGSDIEFSEAKPMHDPHTDVITVGARGGVVYFDPKTLRRNNHRPNIVFTGVLFQGDNTREPLLAAEELDVPSDRRNLTVYFSALEYTDRYLVRYAYKLEGVDNDWNYIGASNSASFNHLPAGRHRLLVKSTNSAGVWVNNEATLSIYVHPAFGETLWAKLLYFIAFCLVVYLCVYIYMLRAKNTLSREMGEMKTRFFTEIGHKLRTPLTLIGGPVSEVLQSASLDSTSRGHLEMVRRNADQMLDLVNRMLRYNTDGSDLYISDDHVPAIAGTVAADAPATASHSVRLLVVEDNADLRHFLVSILAADYDVLQAADGQQGLEAARTEMPDFIITDVMMPVMDGLTMVRHIRQHTDTCHIPIIVLSAKASLDDRIEGLKEGVDDYITKPFSAVYLKTRVANIISQRQMLQQTYVEQIRPADKQTYQLESPQIVDADNEMMKQLLDYLEKRLDDPTLKIEELADAVHLGRSVFYGKVKAIVGMTPVDFVRHIRMQRAQELIVKSTYSFSQIAYMVGFSDPKYFSKSFKKVTGKTPSEYRKN